MDTADKVSFDWSDYGPQLEAGDALLITAKHYKQVDFQDLNMCLQLGKGQKGTRYGYLFIHP